MSKNNVTISIKKYEISICYPFSLLQNNGEIVLGVEINNFKNNPDKTVTLESTSGDIFHASNVIYTAGGGLHQVKGAAVNTVLSPLLVVTPPVCDHNIVILSPDARKTINHLHHIDPVTQKHYSIIGNSDAVQLDKNQKYREEESRNNILQRAQEVFPSLAEIPEKG